MYSNKQSKLHSGLMYLNKVINSTKGSLDRKMIIKEYMSVAFNELNVRQKFFSNYKIIQERESFFRKMESIHSRLNYEELYFQLLISIFVQISKAYESCIPISYLFHKNISDEKIRSTRHYSWDFIPFNDKRCRFDEMTGDQHVEKISKLNDMYRREMEFLRFIRHSLVHRRDQKIFYKDKEGNFDLTEDFYERYKKEGNIIPKDFSIESSDSFINIFKNKILSKLDECFFELIEYVWAVQSEKEWFEK